MNFLLRYGNFLLFMVLEGFALYLVAQYNKKQNEIYISSANLFVGTVYEKFNYFQKYYSIEEIANSLAKENAELRTQLEASKYVAIDRRGTVQFPLDTSSIRPDTAQKKDVIQQFNYINAEVVSNSTSREDNYLTINRGSNHGIHAGMGVISPDGIVGIVKNVSPHFSQVLSILNSSRFQVSAMIKRNRFFGSLKWHSDDERNTRNPSLLVLEGIPKHAEVMKGDTVITSGYSDIFPGELRIGRVTDIRIKNGNNFYTLTVQTWNDMTSIRYVYVVDNLMIKELNDLFREPVKEVKKVNKGKSGN